MKHKLKQMLKILMNVRKNYDPNKHMILIFGVETKVTYCNNLSKLCGT